jgi:CheY-like chemotaxis protein
VLVVEDEAILLMDTADIFTDAGMAAFEAHDADAAIAILSARDDIRVVITDLSMPLGKMDGHAFVRTLATWWPDIGVLVLSGEDAPKPGDLPPGVRFVPKPCRGRDLVSAVFAFVSQQTGSI